MRKARIYQPSFPGRANLLITAPTEHRRPHPIDLLSQSESVQFWIVRAGAMMFSIFGALALGLSIIGLYGVKAYSVARRTREIGIRMALGAQRRAVLGMFMREGSIMVGCGVALGLIFAAATGKILSGILYQVGALDPVAFTVAPLALTVAALIATWLPARRATRVDPLRALRTE